MPNRLIMHRTRNRGVTGVKAGGGKTWHTTGAYINMEWLKDLNPPDPNDPPLNVLSSEGGNVLTDEDGGKFLAPEK